MALTATANAKVRADVINKLGITGCVELIQSFNRPNLHYEVRKKGKNVTSDIATYIRAHHHNQTGVIYCMSRNKCEEVAMQLRENYSISARHYHAAMAAKDKSEVQAAWNSGECRVIVATVSSPLLFLVSMLTLPFCLNRSRLVWVLINRTVSIHRVTRFHGTYSFL